MTELKKKYHTLFFALLLALVPASLRAQPPFLNPQVRNIDNGLPSNFVRHITQDASGFIWMATEQGLCRFDGTEIKVFQHDPADPGSLSHNRVFDMIEDTVNQTLWVATADGLSILDRSTGKFKRHRADLEKTDSLPDNTVRALLRTREGDIWISTWSQGLVRYVPEEDRFERLYVEHTPGNYDYQSVNPTRINSIAMMAQDLENDSILWLATMAGLVRLNTYTRENELYYLDMPTDNLDYLVNSVVSVLPGADGHLYLGTFAVAARFNPATLEFETLLPPGQRLDEPLRWNFVLAVYPKSAQEVWITYRQGVMVYNSLKEEVSYVQENKPDEKKFVGVWFVDSSGRLWNGTEKQGFFMYDPVRQQVLRHAFPVGPDNLDYAPQRILESPDGKYLYVAVEGGEGVYRFQRSDGTWRVIPPGAAYFRENAGFEGVDLAFDRQGRLLALESDRLYRFSANGGRLEEIDLPMEKGVHRFRRVLPDQRGNIWITSRREGVYRLSPDYGLDVHYQEDLNDATTTNQFIWVEHILEDSQGHIWIRLARSYCIYLPEEDRFVRFPYRAGGGSNTYRWLSNFTEDKQGRVWIGSLEEGVGFTDPANLEKGIVKRFSGANGLISNQVAYIAADADGFIWALTDEGLSRVDPETFEIHSFGSGYGIPKGGTVLQLLSNGEMAIGYPGGISIFNPRTLSVNPEKPIPYLTSLKVFDKELSNAVTLFEQQQAKLAPRQNFFSFEFSSINYTMPEKTEYAYKLDGFDEDWIYAGARRYAAYTNVPGGSYTFRVRAANNEGQWSEEPVAFSVWVGTPWYKTTWFQVLGSLLLLGAVYSAYRYRVNDIRRKERMRSEFEKKLATTEMSALRAQMNPHFVFNCLNSIDYYIIKNETEKASDYLNRFSRLIRFILQNSSTNSVSLRDELEALKLYMEMESLRFDNKFDYQVKVARDIDIEQVEVPPMLLQPYIENAIWHGLMHKESSGLVELVLSRDNGNLKCVIEDNGIGREKAQAIQGQSNRRKKSMGMRLTHDRITLINRLYERDTQVRIIDLFDDEGHPRGTRVELQIPLN